jgi:hypothetical protein
MQLNELIGRYVQIRDKKAEIKAQYDAKVAAIDEALDKIEAKLLETFQHTGVESVRTDYGTAYTSTRNYCTAADKQAFLDFIQSREEWGLLDVRPLKSAVESYKDANQELPPGLNWRSEIVVNVRRSD